MSFSRHSIRVAAFKALFALETNPEADKRDLYENKAVLPLNEGEPVPTFLEELVTGVVDHQAELDQLIQEHLASGWTLNRIARPNLVILRLATYELRYNSEVPTAVVINEALELAKDFSDETSRKFINGVLGNLEKEFPRN
ncbi:MAG TPA: transcription antitermination factor NusB [Candidatus Limosilactobacillus faecipullorum]|nr:transcription antitermination factor NusB [Candidatus Limosilactobacillus faecipullorum]